MPSNEQELQLESSGLGGTGRGDMQGLMLSENGAPICVKAGLVFVDLITTTVSAQHVDLMRSAGEAKGIEHAEAPMTKTPKHADVGQANVLYGQRSSA